MALDLIEVFRGCANQELDVIKGAVILVKYLGDVGFDMG